MTCKPFSITASDGTVASGYVCGPKQRPAAPCQHPGCTDPHVALCDYAVQRHRGSTTCDRRLCAKHKHAVPGRADKDHCDVHHKIAQSSSAGTAAKVAHVVEQLRSTGHQGHTCHAKGCNKKLAPAIFMCKKHWALVPPVIRRSIWFYYRAGQEQSKTPSADYLAVAREAIAVVAMEEGRQTSLPLGSPA